MFVAMIAALQSALDACTAPFVGRLGGIYLFVQTLLSLFQGLMLALLVFGALTRSATPRGGLASLTSGVVLAALLTWADVNLLYVVAVTCGFSSAVLLVVSRFAPGPQAEGLDSLVFRRVLRRRCGGPTSPRRAPF